MHWNYTTPVSRDDRPRAKTIGLGDAVAVVAQPIARAADAVLGTHVAECGGCARRRDGLNSAVPDITHPFTHGR